MSLVQHQLKIQKKSFNLLRPESNRKIIKSHLTNTGRMRSLKNTQRNLIIHYESPLERDWYYLLDHDYNCMLFIPQPDLGIAYTTVTNLEKFITLDTWALFYDESKKSFYIRIFEIKHSKQLDKLLRVLTTTDDEKDAVIEDILKSQKPNDKLNISKSELINFSLKMNAIDKWIENHPFQSLDCQFQFLTEKKIRCERLKNIKHLLKAAKHFNPSQIPHLEKGILKKITGFVQENDYSVKELAEVLAKISSHSFQELVSIIKNRIYYDFISIDWNISWDAEENYLKLPPFKLLPIDLIPECEFHEDYVEDIQLELSDSYKISKEDRNLIEPLIQHYGVDAKRKDIRAFCGQYELKYEDIQKIYVAWKANNKIQKKMDEIQFLIKKFGRTGIKKEIYSYLSELGYNDKEINKLYNIYLDYKNNRLVYKKRKRKTSMNEIIYQSMIDTVKTWNKERNTKMLIAYNEWTHDLIKNKGIPEYIYIKRIDKNGKEEEIRKRNIPTYKTFSLEVKKLPLLTRSNKRSDIVHRTQSPYLTRSYSEGMFGIGHVVQMDHTQLDIELIDPITKQPIGRPWITGAIDCLSRTIWGFFISLDPPSQESVTQCILTGIQHKKNTKIWQEWKKQAIQKGYNPDNFEWAGSGLPSLLQVDHGREFHTKSVEEMCMDLDITLEFRPVKTPEYGGFIESIWDTINDAIRDAKISEKRRGLPGCIYSPSKSKEPITERSKQNYVKPDKYDAKKEAKWPLKKFREWLIGYIVMEYYRDSHGRQEHDPIQSWYDAEKGKHGWTLSGSSREINDKEQLNNIEIQSKIIPNLKGKYNYPTLQDKGIRINNAYYTAGWLNDLRDQGIIKKRERIPVRISSWDVRYIWAKHKLSGQFLLLKERSYEKSDRIHKLIQEGILYDFPVSRKEVNEARKYFEIIKEDKKDSSLFLEYTKKFYEGDKLTTSQQKLLAKMWKQTIPEISDLAELALILKTQNFKKLNLPEYINKEDLIEMIKTTTSDGKTVYQTNMEAKTNRITSNESSTDQKKKRVLVESDWDDPEGWGQKSEKELDEYYWNKKGLKIKSKN